ncbi:DUF3592 domain-containing protein [Streptomyces sp. NPDC085927]|uniref:DUF3592 domain-containing protein n=1 Tax=Streptomyces sp. NPDC085927 TaxID=3365738 RepID=UPI0037D8C33F
MEKKKKKRSRDDWTLPPKSAERQSLDRESKQFRTAVRQPPLPQRRLILTLFVMALGSCVAFLVFWLPSQSLVNDLRSRGVSVAAEITASPKNKYGEAGNVKVRFSGPNGEVETVLGDWGGKRPEGLLEGAAVPVTYDPREPTRVLTAEWVEDPPFMTLPMLITLAFTPLLLGGTILLVMRRRKLLKERG